MIPRSVPTNSEIERRLTDIRAAIDDSAARAGRRNHVALVAVTKTVPPNRILEAFDAGQRLFGENRVHEGRDKRVALGARMPGASWHLIGHLQSNKVGSAVDTFDLVQSVDSLRLAQTLDRTAAGRDKVLEVLIEVNVAREASKTGMDPEDLEAALAGMSACQHLSITGLMTIAPLAEDPEDVRWVFRALRQLRDDLGQRLRLDRLRELSMGMSDDYRVAIEEGATMVRLGRAIFGERTPNPG